MSVNLASSVAVKVWYSENNNAYLDCIFALEEIHVILEHAMKIVDEVLEINFAIDDMQFGFMPGKGTIDAVFSLRRIQEEYLAK